MIDFDKIIDYISEDLPFVTHFSDTLKNLDHVYRQYYTIYPYKHGFTSDNLVLMSYIRPLCHNFQDCRRFPDRDYICYIQRTAYDPHGISICFEPIGLATCEIIEAWVAQKFRGMIVDTGFNEDSIIISTEVRIPGRVSDDTDFVLTGFIEPIMQALLDRTLPGEYLIRCVPGYYDPVKAVQTFRLEITENDT
jgi:hypothetical protein